MCERTRAERVIVKSSVAQHYGCKGARHCDLIANGRSQANRDSFVGHSGLIHCPSSRNNTVLSQNLISALSVSRELTVSLSWIWQALMTHCWSGRSTTELLFICWTKRRIQSLESISNSASNPTPARRMSHSWGGPRWKRTPVSEGRSSRNTRRSKKRTKTTSRTTRSFWRSLLTVMAWASPEFNNTSIIPGKRYGFADKSRFMGTYPPSPNPGSNPNPDLNRRRVGPFPETCVFEARSDQPNCV